MQSPKNAIAYNKNVDELDEITYTDYVGLMMPSVTTSVAKKAPV